MPTLRKLTQTDIETREASRQSQRARIEAEYDEILRVFAPGDYGQVEPEGDEQRLTVRNRLMAAASRSGVTLHFLRTAPPALRFRVGAAEGVVVVADEVAAAPQLASPASGDVTTAAPATKRRGRPPKTAAPALEDAVPTAPARRSGRPSRRA